MQKTLFALVCLTVITGNTQASALTPPKKANHAGKASAAKNQKPLFDVSALLGQGTEAWKHALGKPIKTERMEKYDQGSLIYKVKGFSEVRLGTKLSTGKADSIIFTFQKGTVSDWKSALLKVGVDPSLIKASKEITGKDNQGDYYGFELKGVPHTDYSNFAPYDHSLTFSLKDLRSTSGNDSSSANEQRPNETPTDAVKAPSIPGFQAAFTGDLAKLKRLLQNGANIGMQDKDGKTLLHYAVLGGRGAVVRWLVEQKMPMNVRDATGLTALSLAHSSTSDSALEERRADIIGFLQEQGAQEYAVSPGSAASDGLDPKPAEPAKPTTTASPTAMAPGQLPAAVKGTLPMSGRKSSAHAKFPGFASLYKKSRAEVIALLGEPDYIDHDIHFNQDDASGFKDTLCYAKLAGSKFVSVSIVHDKCDGIGAYYDGKPTVTQLKGFLGVTSAITFKAEPTEDKSIVITYIISVAMKALPAGYTGDRRGMMVPLGKDEFKPGDDPTSQGFVKMLKRFDVKAGDYMVAQPR